MQFMNNPFYPPEAEEANKFLLSLRGQLLGRQNHTDILNDFHNYHLKELISALINMNIWAEISDKNATAFTRPGPRQPDGSQLQIKVKVGEALTIEQNRYKNQQRILRTIHKLDLEDLDKNIDEVFLTDVEKIINHNKKEEKQK